MKIKQILFLFVLFNLVGFSWPFPRLFYPPFTVTPRADSWLKREIEAIRLEAGNINLHVLHLSLIAYRNARKQGMGHKPLLTVIDYSKPSTEKRLWVFDLKHGKAILNTWVSHGKNSGGLSAHSFSNQPGSLKSSFGMFITDTGPYIGSHGYSLRISGLERGINDNAYRRDIVFHGAQYVNPDIIRKYGQMGRSWGCPAVSSDTIKSLINTIKEHTLVFVYYPDRNWLMHSKFLIG